MISGGVQFSYPWPQLWELSNLGKYKWWWGFKILLNAYFLLKLPYLLEELKSCISFLMTFFGKMNTCCFFGQETCRVSLGWIPFSAWNYGKTWKIKIRIAQFLSALWVLPCKMLSIKAIWVLHPTAKHLLVTCWWQGAGNFHILIKKKRNINRKYNKSGLTLPITVKGVIKNLKYCIWN